MFALSEGPGRGWSSPLALASGAGAVVPAIYLVVTELGQSEPMLHLRLFTDRMFRGANLAALANFAALTGVLFLLPLSLQQLRGLSAIQSGLATFPQAIGVVITLRLVSPLHARLGPPPTACRRNRRHGTGHRRFALLIHDEDTAASRAPAAERPAAQLAPGRRAARRPPPPEQRPPQDAPTCNTGTAQTQHDARRR